MNAALFVAKHAFVSFSLIVFAISAFSQSPSPVKKYDDHFSKVEIATFSTTDSIYGDVAEVLLITQYRSLRLSVSPHDLRAPFYRAEDTHHLGTSEILRTSVTTYKGIVSGEAGSHVRLTISEGRIEGFSTWVLIDSL